MKEKILSASRIKTLETCSWSYWASYHLKIPQKGNDGSKRGTLCHLIFELLLNSRHKKHYELIMKEGSTKSDLAIIKLITKHLNREQINTEENFEMVCNMIYTGLNNDFFCEKSKLEDPEKEFLLENEEPKYKIKGFMDKLAFYKKKTFLKIIDYKSSKAKFKGEEIESNVQAMAYSLAARKLWPNLKKVVVDFVFLRFPKDPIQSAPESSEEQLKGFERYLAYLYKIINNFTEKTAKSNYAAENQKNRWLCKAGKTWRCPYLDPVDFFVLLDKEGEAIDSSFKNDLKCPDGFKIEKRSYKGCPAHAISTDDFLD